MKRIHPTTNEIFRPHRYADGAFRVADPSLGSAKKLAKNQLPVRTKLELRQFVELGYSVRMRGEMSGQVNLIIASDIILDEYDHEGPPGGGSNNPTPTPVLTEQVQPLKAPEGAVSTSNTRGPLLPEHGRISCAKCFDSPSVSWGSTEAEFGNWKLANNPGSWGGQNPRVLVLGFSKGWNQIKDIARRSHDEIAFSGGRHSLQRILAALELLPAQKTVEDLLTDRNGDFAFGSLVRCSVAKRDPGGWLMSGKDIMSSCLKDRQMGAIISNCVLAFLGTLPPRLRIVVMLGNDMKYIEGCFRAIQQARPALRRLNDVAYRDEQATFVHTIHFKAQGALVPEWCNGTPGNGRTAATDQPRKRELAREAIAGIATMRQRGFEN